MGITGLLPFLKSIQREVHVSSFRGKKVAVDAYCWLHKGAYSCAMQLVMKTEKVERLPFLRYCMKRVNLLRQHDITPILVFDGGYLPTKAGVERDRREKRETYLQKGKALLKEGKKSGAMDCFQKCVDVTPDMALALIKECRKIGVECIVAPYEADSQLTYLQKEGIVDFVITEDSDLLVFGCTRVLFKFDDSGNGKLIELRELGKANKVLIGFTQDSFRQMCILSGCDYLPSVPGVGLGKASKLMKKFNLDPRKVIKSLHYESGKVPKDYEDNFRKAEYTFLYQLVFDPRTQKQVRLNQLPDDVNPNDFEFAGVESSPRKAVGMARGNINPITHEVMDTYSPSKVPPPRSASWEASAMGSSGRNYPVAVQSKIHLSSSQGAKRQFRPPKRTVVEDVSLQDEELKSIYGSPLTEESTQRENESDPPRSQPTDLGSYLSQSPQTVTVSRFFASKVIEGEPDCTPSEGDLSVERRVVRKLQLDHPESQQEETSGTPVAAGSCSHHSKGGLFWRKSEDLVDFSDAGSRSIPESPMESTGTAVPHVEKPHNPAKKRLHFSLHDKFGYSKIKRPRREEPDPLSLLDESQVPSVEDHKSTIFSLSRESSTGALSKTFGSDIDDHYSSTTVEPSLSAEHSSSFSSNPFNTSSQQPSDLPGPSYERQDSMSVSLTTSVRSASQCESESSQSPNSASMATEVARKPSFMTSADFLTPAVGLLNDQTMSQDAWNSSGEMTSQNVGEKIEGQSSQGAQQLNSLDLTGNSLESSQTTPSYTPGRRPSMIFNKLTGKSSQKKRLKVGLGRPGSNSSFKAPRQSDSNSNLKQTTLADNFAYSRRPQMSL